jgi:hypothetical protein
MLARISHTRGAYTINDALPLTHPYPHTHFTHISLSFLCLPPSLRSLSRYVDQVHTSSTSRFALAPIALTPLLRTIVAPSTFSFALRAHTQFDGYLYAIQSHQQLFEHSSLVATRPTLYMHCMRMHHTQTRACWQ